MALQDIVDKIIADAKEEAQQIINQGNNTYSQTLKEEKKKLDDYYDKKRSRLNQEIDNYRLRQQQVVDLEARKQLLQVKQEEISSFFDKAKETLVQMPEDDYQNIMLKILEKSIEHDNSEILIGEYDQKRLNKKFIEKAQKKWPQLKLSNAIVPGAYGFVINFGSVEINCTIDSLLKQEKEEIIISLNKMIQE